MHMVRSKGSARRIDRFRSAILVGASACALVALSPAAWAQNAPSADQPKWQPYLSIGGQAGGSSNDQLSGARITAFVPVVQDLNSFFYVRLGIGTQASHSTLANIGLGYRTKLDSEWIAGLFGGFDATSTRFGRTYTQASLGAEAMSADWDLRINGYLATQSKPRDIPGSYSLFLHDTRIAILQGQEVAYSGVDGEVGYRVYNTKDMDIRLFAGGFSFTHDSTSAISGGRNFNVGPGSIQGPVGRAEVDLYNVSLFGSRTRLIGTGEIRHDNVRGTSGYVGVSLQVPLGASGSNDPDEDELDRRMVDPVRRQDNVLTEWGFSKPEPVTIYNGSITSAPTNTVYYADNTAGAGSYADPTTLPDATSRGPVNQFVVAIDRNGPVNATGTVVQSGETVTGPGTFSVHGVTSGRTFSHDFAPHSGPVHLTTTGADGITLDSHTNLYGVSIDGPFTNAIYGHNVTDVHISGVTIDGGGTGANGIYIHQDSGASSSIAIDNTTISGVTADGIKLTIDNATADTSTANIDLSGLTVNAGQNGVNLSSTISGGSNETIYLGVHNSTLTGGLSDINLGSTVSAGSSLGETLVVDPTYLSGGDYGLYISGMADGGTLTQTIGLSQVYVSGTSFAGIAVYGRAQNSGNLSQSVTLDHVTVTGSYQPIIFGVAATSGGTATQTVGMSHVSATGGYYDNIALLAHADYGGAVHQYVTMSDVMASNSVAGSGVFAGAYAYDNATTIQRLTADHFTAAGNYLDGARLQAVAGNYYPGDTAVAAQYVTFTHASFTGNGGSGASAFAIGTSDSISRQDVSITNSALDANAGFGFHAQELAGFYGGAQQNIYLGFDDVSSNGLGGASFISDAFALGSAQQNIYILGGTFNNNGGDGIAIDANTFFAGQVLQNAGIYNVTATGNAGDGLHISANAYGYGIGTYAYYSHIGQNIIAAYDTFSNNARNGVEIHNYTGYGAQLNQFVYLFGSHMDHNGPTSGPVPSGAGNGVYEYSKANAFGYYGGAIFTNLYSDVYVVTSTADHNAVDGVRFKGNADGPSYLIQHIDVLGADASYNGRTGLVSYANAQNFYSLNIQYISLAGSTLNHNGLDGAAFLAYQSYGPLSFGAAIQDVSVSASTFNHNTRDGLYAFADATAEQGRAEQHFTIQGSYFNHNGYDGLAFVASAHDGVYLSGYDCGQLQGLYGGCAFVRQTVQMIGSQADSNGRDGIYIHNYADNFGAVYTDAGRPAYTPTLLVGYSDISNNGQDGVGIVNSATNNSYLYSYAVFLGDTISGNGRNGIYVHDSAGSGSLILQKTIVYGVPGYLNSSVSGNYSNGVYISANASGGTVQQLVGVYGSYLASNGGSGLLVVGAADDSGIALPTPGYVADPGVSVVGQYVNLTGNYIGYNALNPSGFYLGGGGAVIAGYANGGHSVVQQQVTAQGNSFVDNYYIGLGVAGFAQNGGAVTQSLKSQQNQFSGNLIGEVLLGQADSLGFVKQNLYDSYNNFSGNFVGLAIVGGALTGGNVYQNLSIYYDTAHNNVDGLFLREQADGYTHGAYYYYSHVSQNLIAAYDDFSNNASDGISVTGSNSYGASSNQFLYFFGVTANHNGHDGFYMNTTLTSTSGNGYALATQQYTDLYLVNSAFDHNAANGVELRAHNYGPVYQPAYFGGYSYQIQHNFIAGTDASYNGADGLNVSTNQQGRYGLDAQYFTISGSRFDNNGSAGAHFLSKSYYGPSGFGDSFQQISISGSDFSYNAANGLDLMAEASGNQGRAEQHVTITGSYFDHNTGDGVHVYASATDGVYVAGHPCTSGQGLAGGCAFVRQNVTIEGSDVSNNAGNGVFVGTYANNYGAIYGASGRPHAPTLELYGVTVNDNGSRGLDASNHVGGNSYLYQYVAAIDATFDHNASDGVYAASYVGGASSMLQRELLYSYHTTASASYNAGNGFKSTIEALGGSYARDVNIVEGVDLSRNGSFGFDGAVAYADGTSTGLQINAVYFNSVNYNGDGVGLYSIGPGSQQISYIGGNEVGHNAFVGVYGEANFGAFQYIGVYTFGNNVHDNGTNYLFNAFGGATQILN